VTDAPNAAKRPSSGGFADLKTRILSAVVLAVLAVGALAVGGVPFTIFWLVAAVAIVWEWQALVGPDRRRARFFVGAGALTIACAFMTYFDKQLAALVVGIGAAIILAGAAIVAALADRSMRVWAGAGVIYAGVLLISVCAIRPPMPAELETPYALRAIIWLFAVVWGTDVMAYFGGRLIGGPKLWPRVSAGKTWSGTIVGIVSGALLGLAVASIGASYPVRVLPLLVVGLLASAAAQAGDLMESSIKRRFGVKDSSRLIPGHGGVMDRLDGFITAALLVAVLGAVRNAPTIAEGLFAWP
jgi:phosphatidate cytidylyltransferase